MMLKKGPANDNKDGNLLRFAPRAQPRYEDIDLDTLCSQEEFVNTSTMFETAADTPLEQGVALGIDHEGMFSIFNADGMTVGDILLMLERARRFVLDYADGLIVPEGEEEDADC